MPTPILKTENLTKMENKERKLSVEELVQIGDAIHNSHCSLIIVANKTDKENESKVMYANHGDYTKARNMIFEVISRSEPIRELLFDALMLCELKTINDNAKNKK